MKMLYTERSTSSDVSNPYISQMKRLFKTIKEMQSLATQLIPHTFPQVEFSEEQHVLCLKKRTTTIDGYEVILCYSDAQYKEYLLSSLQIQPIHGPFLPFAVVCKVARAFFGSRNLSYIEFFRNNKKVYCWTIKAREGKRLLPGKKTKPGSYEGFYFRILHPSSVDLF